MLAVFQAIVPIFALIVAGNLLRRAPAIDDKAWPGLEQLGFWFLYPALLFATIAKADFAGLRLDAIVVSLLTAVTVSVIGVYALWPVLKRTGLVAQSEFSTVYQCSVRWNGFMAFAIAEKLFPPEGAAIVALGMVAIIIPINLGSIFVVTRFADANADWGRIFYRIATNPLIIAALLGLAVRQVPGGLPEPAAVTLDLVARAALGMGLIAIGAGLKPGDVARLRAALWLPVLLKLLIFPAMLVAIALANGISGESLVYLALCGAVPTAMNGYLLARQMGGDAPLYAAVTTLQTLVSFFTIPAIILIVGQIASG